jgi:hypothetical protein
MSGRRPNTGLCRDTAQAQPTSDRSLPSRYALALCGQQSLPHDTWLPQTTIMSGCRARPAASKAGTPTRPIRKRCRGRPPQHQLRTVIDSRSHGRRCSRLDSGERSRPPRGMSVNAARLASSGRMGAAAADPAVTLMRAGYLSPGSRTSPARSRKPGTGSWAGDATRRTAPRSAPARASQNSWRPTASANAL